MHDFPETASFLTPEERAFVAYRLKYGHQRETMDEVTMQIPQSEDRNRIFIKAAFLDWQIWIAGMATLGIVSGGLSRSPNASLLTAYR